MKIVEITGPQSRSFETADINRVFSYLEKRCQPILRAYKATGTMTYRGVPFDDSRVSRETGLSNPYVLMSKVHKDRMPWAVSKKGKEAVQKMQSFLPYAANRYNSIFTGSYTTASKYGRIFAVFPIGNFNYLWSRSSSPYMLYDMEDTYEMAKNQMYNERDLGDLYHSEEEQPQDLKFYKLWAEFFQNYSKLSDNDIETALMEKREILINCDRYILIYQSSNLEKEKSDSRIILPHELRQFIKNAKV